jgi:hypothetical protein
MEVLQLHSVLLRGCLRSRRRQSAWCIPFRQPTVLVPAEGESVDEGAHMPAHHDEGGLGCHHVQSAQNLVELAEGVFGPTEKYADVWVS